MRRLVPFGFVLLLAAGPAAAGSGAEVTVANRSRQPVNEIYVSPSPAAAWGDDRLGEQTLPPGQSAHVQLPPGQGCAFDVQVVYDDASREERHGVDLCRLHVLDFDASHASVAVLGPLAHGVTVVNRAPRPIQQVLISPSAAGEWGEDWLAHRTLSAGDSATLAYRGDCIADLRVVFDNRSAEERRDLDLCRAARVVIAPGWTTAAAPGAGAKAVAAALLTVSNRSGREVVALYVFPDGSADRGPQLLASGGLGAGALVTVALVRPASLCRFAVEVTFDDDAPPHALPPLDLCAGHELVIPAPA